MKAGRIGTLCLTVFLVTAATPARAETKGEGAFPIGGTDRRPRLIRREGAGRHGAHDRRR
jgi:hypothetical protein